MAILTGAAVGTLAFILCAYIYSKGVGDIMKRKQKNTDQLKSQGAETENELMRKYIALLSYDPYGNNQDVFSEKEGNRT